jgi:hypothetical protein
MEATYDISGFCIFSGGAIGAAHTMAHQMLDEGSHREGHRLLGEWLRDREGSGSDWTHIQWHMLVFELAVGAWSDAYRRYRNHILPVATGTEAATDAPAALWRLSLAAGRPVELRWDAVRASAMARMHSKRDPYVELHDLLALAGAGDVNGLDDWLHRSWLRSHNPSSDADDTLRDFARALRAYAAGRYAVAARTFPAALAALPRLGGSRAQNELFVAIYRNACARGAGGPASVANDTTAAAAAPATKRYPQAVGFS